MCQKVDFSFLSVKLQQAGVVLFRCTKIRKSKPAWVRFSQSDVNGNNESSMTRCCLVLPSVAEHHCVLPGSLRFTNFLPKSPKSAPAFVNECFVKKILPYAVHTFFTRQSNNISMIAHKIIYVEFNGVIQPMITIILDINNTALCIFLCLEQSIFFHI